MKHDTSTGFCNLGTGMKLLLSKVSFWLTQSFGGILFNIFATFRLNSSQKIKKPNKHRKKNK